ncbi:MAG: diguanylate cyclase, partial [Kovacikia sp.]
YGKTKQDGIKRLQKALECLRQYVFLAPNGASFKVTFSAGMAQLSEDSAEFQTLYHLADKALYQAKAAGRNQIFADKSVQEEPPSS